MVINYLNLLFGTSPKSVEYWKEDLKNQILKDFPYGLTKCVLLFSSSILSNCFNHLVCISLNVGKRQKNNSCSRISLRESNTVVCYSNKSRRCVDSNYTVGSTSICLSTILISSFFFLAFFVVKPLDLSYKEFSSDPKSFAYEKPFDETDLEYLGKVSTYPYRSPSLLISTDLIS